MGRGHPVLEEARCGRGHMVRVPASTVARRAHSMQSHMRQGAGTAIVPVRVLDPHPIRTLGPNARATKQCFGRALPLPPDDATASNCESLLPKSFSTSARCVIACRGGCDWVQGAAAEAGGRRQNGRAISPFYRDLVPSWSDIRAVHMQDDCSSPHLALLGSPDVKPSGQHHIGLISHMCPRVYRRFCFFNTRPAVCVAGTRILPDEAVLGPNKDSRVLVWICAAASVIMRASQNITAWASRLPGWLSGCRSERDGSVCCNTDPW